MPRCLHCLEESSSEHYKRVVHNHSALHGPWKGWRLAGRYLVSPDGDRILPERVRGMLFREKFRARPKKNACVVVGLDGRGSSCVAFGEAG